MRGMTLRSLLLVTLMTALILAGASPGPGGPVVVVAVGADIDSFNEYVAASTFAFDLADQLFLNLMEERPAVTPGPPDFLPRLARSWTISPDGLSVTFQLRDDVRWSDGQPTTADDVLYTWQVQTDPRVAWPDADLKANIAAVEVGGPQSVTVRLKRRSPYALLDINEGHILPRHVFARLPPDKWAEIDFSKGLVTNGPFRLASWKPGQSIELAPNPDYYEKGLPRLSRVVFRIVTDPGVRLQQLFAGENDVLESVPPEAVDRVTADPSLILVRFDQRMYTYLCWNDRHPMFADPRVRRALTMALNRDEMLRVLARGMGRPSAGPIVQALWAADATLKPPPFDPAEAGLLLKKSGWEDHDKDGVLDKDGQAFQFDLEFNRGNSLRENIALRAASQLGALGVKATPRAVEWAAFQKKHRDGAFDAFVASRIVSTRVNLDAFTTGADQNYAGYSSPELDEVARRAASASTIDEARPLWTKAQQIIARDQPVTFLFEQDRLYAVRRRILEIEPGPLGLFGGLRRWRVEPSTTETPRRRSG